MVTPDSKDFSSSKVKAYESSYIGNVKNDMAIIKYNQGWDNFMAWCEGAMKLLSEVLDAMSDEQKIIDLSKMNETKRKETEIPLEKVFNLNQLWWGGCGLTRKRSWKNPAQYIKGSERWWYDISKAPSDDPMLEKIKYPAMDSMTPVGRLKDPTLLIRITEAIPLYIAWQGMDYDTIIREGGYYYKVGNKMVAKFPEEYMYSKAKKTMKISRDCYARIIRLQKRKFLENWIPVQNRIHKIIEYSENNIESIMSDFDSLQKKQNEVELPPEHAPPELDTESEWI